VLAWQVWLVLPVAYAAGLCRAAGNAAGWRRAGAAGRRRAAGAGLLRRRVPGFTGLPAVCDRLGLPLPGWSWLAGIVTSLVTVALGLLWAAAAVRQRCAGYEV